MTAAVIILSAAFAVMAVLFVMQRKENSSIASQLSELKGKDTNSLVSSVYGMADELIININSLLKDMRETRAEYNQNNHALQQMMTNISHDLRTPLTSAMGYIDLIRNSELTEEEKQRELAIIEKRLTRLEELINSFFELSRIVSCGKEPEMISTDLVSVMQESIVHYFDDYCGRGRSIIFSCAKRKIMILSNRDMLLRIFDNLINNALKHGTGDLFVEVEDKDDIRIVFKNRLIISDIDIGHIFDEFYTTDISRTKGNTGLGLAIAKQFTELLGGDISAVLEGGEFVLTLILKNDQPR